MVQWRSVENGRNFQVAEACHRVDRRWESVSRNSQSNDISDPSSLSILSAPQQWECHLLLGLYSKRTCCLQHYIEKMKCSIDCYKNAKVMVFRKQISCNDHIGLISVLCYSFLALIWSDLYIFKTCILFIVLVLCSRLVLLYFYISQYFFIAILTVRINEK